MIIGGFYQKVSHRYPENEHFRKIEREDSDNCETQQNFRATDRLQTFFGHIKAIYNSV